MMNRARLATWTAALLTLGAMSCEPEPPPNNEELIQIELVGGESLAADGLSQIQIRVKLPEGTRPKTVKLFTTGGTLSAAEAKSDPALATADFFLTSDTLVRTVRLTAQVEEHTRYKELELTRFCPNELNLASTDAVIIANGNNSTELTATVLRTDRAGTPSQGLKVEFSVKRTDNDVQKSAGTLTVVDSPLTGATGQVKARLRAGQDAGTVRVEARVSCVESGGTTVDATQALEVIYVPPAS